FNSRMTALHHPSIAVPERNAPLYRHERLSRLSWRAIAAFALPLFAYLLTMAPTIYNLDSAELTTAAYTCGIVRATGYPLYLMIGRLWSQLPLGDVGFRMNLFSAVCGAASVFMVERILARWQLNIWAVV